MTQPRWTAWLCAATLACATPLAAVAQDITPAQSEQFGKAQALYEAKDYKAALPLFEALLRDTSSPNARLYVARALRDLGRLPEAFDAMSLTVREASARAQTERKYEQTRDGAAAELALLQERVGHVVIAIADAPADVSASLDGVPLTKQQLGAAITVMPGSHRIEIRGAGVETAVRELEVGGGQTKTEAIALKKTETKQETKPRPTEQRGGEVRILGIVAAGIGVAGLATFAATTVLANDRFATLEDECGNARCTNPKYADIVDEGKTFELVSTVTLVVGAVFAAGSIPMIIFGGPSEASPAAAAFAPVPGGAVVSVHGKF